MTLLCYLRYQSTRTLKSIVATTAFERHLWYLSEILIAFAFFDDAVTTEEKRMMVAALRELEGQDEPLKQIPPFQHPNTKTLNNFVTKNTNNFFTILGISQEFLQADPSEWECDTEYKRSQRLVQTLRVVNDLAERGVALIQEFNSTLTRDEEQKQYLLQVIEDHRRRFAAPTKSSAIGANLQTMPQS